MVCLSCVLSDTFLRDHVLWHVLVFHFLQWYQPSPVAQVLRWLAGFSWAAGHSLLSPFIVSVDIAVLHRQPWLCRPVIFCFT